MPSYDESRRDGRRRPQPHANYVENAFVNALDRKNMLEFRCGLVHLVAARIATRPALQKMLADIVMGREPGGPGSLLEGQSMDRVAKTRSRLVREIVDITHLLGSVCDDPAQQHALERLAAAMRKSLRAVKNISNHPSESDDDLDSDAVSISDAIAGWVGLMKESGVHNIHFLMPLGRLSVVA
jgi:hypothetical protein